MKETKEIKGLDVGGVKAKKNNLLNKVQNLRSIKVTGADIEAIKSSVIENIDAPSDLKAVTKDFVANAIKNSISLEHPEYYQAFAKMNYDELMSHISNRTQLGNKATKEMSATFSVPADFVAQLEAQSGVTGIYQTSFQISPNSFWNNVTNVLNKVTVGDNYITTGESFNAYTFFKSENLDSGEAKLVTQGTPISGTCLLNQNELVPNSTQMVAGYQASLGVFINTDSAQNVGGGVGVGLFQLYAMPINVLKLAVTLPQQFSQIVKIFYATAFNSKMFTLWMICTMNLLSSINNIIVDTNNTDIRSCLNGTLFPAIKTMQNPTNEFNLGIPTYYNGNNTTGTQLTLNDLSNSATMSAITTTYRSATLQSDYLVNGSQTYPRIQSMKKEDIHLIVSPKFFVALKSGTLSELFHWEFQRLEEYVLPENIHMLYKQVDITANYMNKTNESNLYPFQIVATLGERWLPDNVIVLLTKTNDTNNWCAQYGDVWTTEMKNEWGAGMVATGYMHYAIYGGVLPWSNGCVFYFKNLLNTKCGAEQPTEYDFSLNTTITQSQNTSSIS